MSQTNVRGLYFEQLYSKNYVIFVASKSPKFNSDKFKGNFLRSNLSFNSVNYFKNIVNGKEGKLSITH
jgi:hypothetical protein